MDCLSFCASKMERNEYDRKPTEKEKEKMV